jgi:hypothetical protein
MAALIVCTAEELFCILGQVDEDSKKLIEPLPTVPIVLEDELPLEKTNL